MSGLDELTREELIALVIKLYETVESQAKRIAELEALEAIVQSQAERISELEEELTRFKGGKGSALQIKGSVKKAEHKSTRKRRMQSFACGNRMPDEVVCHAIDECPNCGRKLSGGTVKWKHQVIEAPVAPVKVTDHLFIERRCGVCGERCAPDASEVLGEVVVGKKTIGIGLMSLIAYLKIVCRVPVNLIRQLLESLYGLSVSKGEICELLHEVARLGKDEYDGLLERVRGSPVVHGDETGWREDGVNG